jgi:Dna[CI] antecedent, DciA
MPDTRIGPLLNSLPEIQSLTRELKCLADLRVALSKALPGHIATMTHVAMVKAGELILVVDNGAVAAKLNQLSPRILTAIGQLGYDITGIRVQVQVRIPDKPLPEKQIYLGPEACSAINSLTERLDPSPLKSALKRLARHNTGRS